MSHIAKTETEGKVNFLASEVGLRTITYQFDTTTAAGTIINGKGVVFDDVDATDGAHEGALIVAGHILNDCLPVEATEEQITAFAKQGLFFENSVTVERPK